MDIRKYIPRHESSGWRQHNGDGISQDARVVIKDHNLSINKIMDAADYYGIKEGVDFNKAPDVDFANAPLGKNLVNVANAQLAFDTDMTVFAKALSTSEHSTADSIMSEWLKSGRITDADGKSIYGEWRHLV